MPTEVELAYMAGFFDGDGCITVATNTNKGLTLRAYVAQNTIEPLLLFQNVWPKGVMAQQRGRRVIHFYTHGRTAVGMLEALLPYLIVKKEQAELAIRWYEPDFDRHAAKAALSEMKVYKDVVSNV